MNEFIFNTQGICHFILSIEGWIWNQSVVPSIHNVMKLIRKFEQIPVSRFIVHISDRWNVTNMLVLTHRANICLAKDNQLEIELLEHRTSDKTL